MKLNQKGCHLTERNCIGWQRSMINFSNYFFIVKAFQMNQIDFISRRYAQLKWLFRITAMIIGKQLYVKYSKYLKGLNLYLIIVMQQIIIGTVSIGRTN